MILTISGGDSGVTIEEVDDECGCSGCLAIATFQQAVKEGRYKVARKVLDVIALTKPEDVSEEQANDRLAGLHRELDAIEKDVAVIKETIRNAPPSREATADRPADVDGFLLDNTVLCARCGLDVDGRATFVVPEGATLRGIAVPSGRVSREEIVARFNEGHATECAELHIDGRISISRKRPEKDPTTGPNNPHAGPPSAPPRERVAPAIPELDEAIARGDGFRATGQTEEEHNDWAAYGSALRAILGEATAAENPTAALTAIRDRAAAVLGESPYEIRGQRSDASEPGGRATP